MTDSEISRQQIMEYIKTMLGDGMIDIELEPKHYNIAIDRALAKFRQRSQASTEESYGFMTLHENQNEYILAPEVMQVRQVFRRSIGSRTGGGDGGTIFEPFNLAYTNTYLLSSSNMGGLATYYLFGGYQKLVGKMFGSFINFTFNPTTRKLIVQQRPQSNERVLLQIYNKRPDFAFLQDTYANIWIKEYTLANCKLMLGEAREKFGTIASPQGGTQLNGTALKSEAIARIKELEDELKKGDAAAMGGYTWIIG